MSRPRVLAPGTLFRPDAASNARRLVHEQHQRTRGDVIAGGYETVLGEQRNGLLMKFSAL